MTTRIEEIKKNYALGYANVSMKQAMDDIAFLLSKVDDVLKFKEDLLHQLKELEWKLYMKEEEAKE